MRVEHFADEAIFESPRAQWIAGPWSDEPDIVEWRLEGVPYPLLVVRGRTGCLCGYVGVYEGHALYRKWSGDRTRFTCSDLPEVINGAFPSTGIYTPTGSDPCWWLGFHCGGDEMPAVAGHTGRRYVPLDEVRARVEALARAFLESPFFESGPAAFLN